MASILSQPTISVVEIHPIVLLSVTDHYVRVAKDTKKRVVGCLLGEKTGTTLNVTNSFAVPFDEEERPPETWFLDYNYLEDMAFMFKRVNAREKIVGWYSTGPKLRKNDIDIHKLFLEYTNEPILSIIRVNEENEDIPTESYLAIDVIQHDGRHEKEFTHVMSNIVASEAEEVGVEHLLREIQDVSLSTLTTEVSRKLSSLKGLNNRLKSIRNYLDFVCQEQLPINQDILRNLQLIFNFLPNLSQKELIQSFQIKKNDMMLNIYMASLLRSILSLDQLLENKLENKRREEKKEEGKDKKDKDKEKDKNKDEKDKEKDKEKEKDKNKEDNKDKDKDKK